MTKSIKVFISSITIAVLFSTFPVTVKNVSSEVAYHSATSGVISEMYAKPIGKLYAGVVPKMTVKIEKITVSEPIVVEQKKEVVVAEAPVQPIIPEPEPLMSNSDIIIIARLTMAEAEGESEYGKRLVIDSVLNRMDKTGGSVHDVVWAKHQYTSMENGRYAKMSAPDEVQDLVRQELQSRTNDKVYYFSAGGYSNFGKSMFKEEHHYFSSYK